MARGLFEEHGVEMISMHGVARAAGVGQGTLYRRFEHKGALCAELLYESTRRFSEDFRARAAGREGVLGGDVGSPLGATRWHRTLQRGQRGAPGCDQGLRRRARPRRSVPRSLLPLAARRRRGGPGASRGAGRDPTPDVEALPDALLAPLNIDLYLFQRRDLGLAPDRILRSLDALLLDGLRGGTGRPDA